MGDGRVIVGESSDKEFGSGEGVISVGLGEGIMVDREIGFGVDKGTFIELVVELSDKVRVGFGVTGEAVGVSEGLTVIIGIDIKGTVSRTGMEVMAVEKGYRILLFKAP